MYWLYCIWYVLYIICILYIYIYIYIYILCIVYYIFFVLYDWDIFLEHIHYIIQYATLMPPQLSCLGRVVRLSGQTRCDGAEQRGVQRLGWAMRLDFSPWNNLWENGDLITKMWNRNCDFTLNHEDLSLIYHTLWWTNIAIENGHL